MKIFVPLWDGLWSFWGRSLAVLEKAKQNSFLARKLSLCFCSFQYNTESDRYSFYIQSIPQIYSVTFRICMWVWISESQLDTQKWHTHNVELFELVFRGVNQTWLWVKSVGEDRQAGCLPLCSAQMLAHEQGPHQPFAQRWNLQSRNVHHANLCGQEDFCGTVGTCFGRYNASLAPPILDHLHAFAKMLFI